MEFEESELEHLRNLLCSYKLQDHEPEFLKQALLGTGLLPRSSQDSDIEIGASKLGGLPDLPDSFIWPVNKGRALAFIVQLNLSDLPEKTRKSFLPGSGLLSFFYDDSVWGFDPADNAGFKVVHFDSTAADLKRRKPPEQPEKRVFFGLFREKPQTPEFKACALAFKPFISLPYEPDDCFKLSEEESENYFELLESIGCRHRLLAHAEPIQGPMELECQLVSSGINCGTAVDMKRPEIKRLEAGAADWQLLLQLDSETEHSNMMWGDAGCLYFWIRKSDLAQGKFENTWLIAQCH